MSAAPAVFHRPGTPLALAAFALFLLAGASSGAMAGPAPEKLVVSEVKMENLPFRQAFAAIQSLLVEKHLEPSIDPVHDIPGHFDNPRSFTFTGKDVALSDLLTSFCRNYGLEWKLSGEKVVFSLPRPRPQPTSEAR